MQENVEVAEAQLFVDELSQPIFGQPEFICQRLYRHLGASIDVVFIQKPNQRTYRRG